MNKVLLFLNPASRHGARAAHKVTAWLEENQFELLNPGYDPTVDDMLDVIERFRNEAGAVIVGGGDGSVNHALPALMKTGLPLLLVPLGTANNLARTLSIPTDLILALSLLRDGKIKSIDIGIAKTLDTLSDVANAGPPEVPFVNVIGIGMSAKVNRFVPSGQKRWLGVFAFALTALRVAARMSPFHVAIECDGKMHHGRTWQITVCNGRNYGNGLVVAPDATLNDQILHGISTEIGKWWHGFGLLPRFRDGRLTATPRVTTFSGKVIRIVTRHSKHVDIDGDIKLRTPLEITVRPKSLKIFVPKT